jgi:general secretion pathway protein D
LPGTSKQGVVFGASNPTGPPGLFDANTQTFSPPSGLAVGAVSFPFTIDLGGTSFLVNNLTALIRAVQTDDDFNIIATPQLMTLDNEEASVVVATNIPFSTRVDQGAAVTDRAIQSFEYRDVGTTLKITPQISESRFVKLKIYQEFSRVVSESVVSGDQTILAPTTRKRTTETNVEVKDGQTVVISGLIGEDNTAVRTSTPCIGDIPLLGWLFKNVSKENIRTNLLVFLTPYIVASPHDAEKIYEDKYKYMDDIQQEEESGGLPELEEKAG